MAKNKQRGALERLQVSLAGVDAALTILGTILVDVPDAKRLIAESRRHCDEAHEALTEARSLLGKL